MCLFRAGLVTLEVILVGFVALLPIGRVAKGATRKGMHEQQQQQQLEKEKSVTVLMSLFFHKLDAIFIWCCIRRHLCWLYTEEGSKQRFI